MIMGAALDCNCEQVQVIKRPARLICVWLEKKSLVEVLLQNHRQVGLKSAGGQGFPNLLLM